MEEKDLDTNLRYDENSVYEIDPECVLCLGECIPQQEYQGCCHITKREHSGYSWMIVLIMLLLLK